MSDRVLFSFPLILDVIHPFIVETAYIFWGPQVELEPIPADIGPEGAG